MLPKVKTHLHEIQQACICLAQFAAGRSRPDYESDVYFRSAVERQFTILGEALNLALRLDPSLAQQISETRAIVAFRNVLLHGYAAIDNDKVWAVLQTKLPQLRQEVDALLAQP